MKQIDLIGFAAGNILCLDLLVAAFSASKQLSCLLYFINIEENSRVHFT